VAFKSLDELRRAASVSDTIEIEISDMPLLLEDGLNSLLFNDPFSKVCFTASVVSEFLRAGSVIYVDLDTLFSSYFRNGMFTFSGDTRDLLIYLPLANQFEEMLPDICSAIASDIALVVMDSLGSFYHLYDRIKVGALNHLLSSYVSLVLNHVNRYGSRLLVTSMIRHRKTTEWILAPSSRRLIESKSDVILLAEPAGSNLAVNVLKHSERRVESKKLLLSKTQIPIKF
jgi:hypothetical protein